MACLLLTAALCIGCSVAEEAAEQSVSGVTYEIFVASFQDSNDDGVGDLQGVIQRLDYLRALGVSRVWLMPIHPSLSYHKYDVTDYLSVAPEYGTLADFDALVSACASAGIGVTLDLVVNHTSSEHPWFKEACAALASGTDSPYIDWYNFTREAGQHPVPGAEGWFYEGQFSAHMPDLNLDSAAVRAEIARIMAFWQGHGVTGFRLDAVTSYYTGAPEKNAAFLRFLNETAKAVQPDCTLVGEAWTDEATLLTLYKSGIDSLFNFPSAQQDGRLLKSALKGKGAAAATALADWNAKLHAVSPTSLDAPFLTNHDLARSAGVLHSDAAMEKVAAMLYLLLPGAPTVYYGEELGMSGSGRDENKRLPMLWSGADPSAQCLPPQDADQAQRLTRGVAEQEADPDSLLHAYRALIALRRAAPELLRGTMTAVDAGQDILCCFTVTEGGSRVLVVINASTDTAAAYTPEAPVTLLGSWGGAAEDHGELRLPPVSCMLLRYNE